MLPNKTEWALFYCPEAMCLHSASSCTYCIKKFICRLGRYLMIATDLIWTQLRSLLAIKRFTHGTCCINDIMYIMYMWTVSGIKSFPKSAYLGLVGQKLYAEGTLKWLKTDIFLSLVSHMAKQMSKQHCTTHPLWQRCCGVILGAIGTWEVPLREGPASEHQSTFSGCKNLLV